MKKTRLPRPPTSNHPLSPPENPVRYVPGVGPRIAQLFAQKGILTAEDLLHFFPYKYLDRRRLDPIGSLDVGSRTVVGRVLSAGVLFFGRRMASPGGALRGRLHPALPVEGATRAPIKKRKVFEILLGDETGTVSLKWFHFYPDMQWRFRKQMVLMASGTVSLYRGERQFVHPEIQILNADMMEEVRAPGIVPTYSQIEGLGQRVVRKILRNCLREEAIPDPLPPSLLERHQFPDKRRALEEIHFPQEASLESLNGFHSAAHRREIFEEFFFLELALAVKRGQVKKGPGIAFSWSPEEIRSSLAKLPFLLTGAQKRVLLEILRDMEKASPMNRLIQGDVGCGKTVVALLAAEVAVRNGYQAALMVPTEILAEQHFQTAKSFLSPFKIPVALLTGSQPPSEKMRVRSLVRRGVFPFIVGTHALIQREVVFKNLGLVIIDEQHRFGVLQRATLTRREAPPDVLVMTATPIPRTLAMTVYGDLDFSTIDEMPPGRPPIRTEVLESRDRRGLYARIAAALDRGEQGYIVYPLVEESEKLALKDAVRMSGELEKIFPGRKLALLHGRVVSEEKERVFRLFREGGVDLLVCTTVVEVGVDVSNATLMVIEHADRFGLSQLHQLRGRVGRGEKASTCLLVSDYQRTEAAYRRLQVMCQTQDGFRIAEEDLKLRGPGDFLGTRQSGLPEFRLANLIRDASLLKEARAEASRLIGEDPGLEKNPLLKTELNRRWKEKLALAEVG